MKPKKTIIYLTVAALLGILATGAAISAQDRYIVKVPGGLAFSEFKG